MSTPTFEADSRLVTAVMPSHEARLKIVEGRPKRRIVIHSTETGPYSARTIAGIWQSRPTPGREASAHYIIEPARPLPVNPNRGQKLFDTPGGGTVIQCVSEQNVAFAAPSQNHHGIQLEHVGRTLKWNGRAPDGRQVAKPQPRTEWGKPGAPWHAENLLQTSAMLAADICVRNRICIVELSAEEIVDDDEASGFVTHATVSRACRLARERGMKRAPWYRFDRNTWVNTDHGDPGKHWPMEAYLELVREDHARLLQNYVYGEGT